MSFAKSKQVTFLYRSIRSRVGVSKAREWLAEEVGCSEKHLRRILYGSQRTGSAWERLKGVLTDDELKLLPEGDS